MVIKNILVLWEKLETKTTGRLYFKPQSIIAEVIQSPKQEHASANGKNIKDA
jgi:hypothetical protein